MKKDLITSIREEILEEDNIVLRKKVKIVFDGRQYNIRIPKKMAEKAMIDPKKDEFEFVLSVPKKNDREHLPSLIGELVEKE